MKIDSKHIIIFILCVVIAVVSYVAYNPKHDDSFEKYLGSQIKYLQDDKDTLLKLNVLQQNKINNYIIKIDSFEKLKPAIIKKYDKKYKDIDNFNSLLVTDEYNRIFSKNNIK